MMTSDGLSFWVISGWGGGLMQPEEKPAPPRKEQPTGKAVHIPGDSYEALLMIILVGPTLNTCSQDRPRSPRGRRN